MADGVLQYIGARYVPQFYLNSDGTPEWKPGVAFEPLTIVTWNNNSYTSRKPVPAEIGEPSVNPEYWAQTGVYNAQIGQLQTDVSNLQSDVEDLQEETDKIYWYTPEMFGAVGDGETDDSAAFQAMFNAIPVGAVVKITKPLYLVNSTITIAVNDCKMLGVARGEYTPCIHTNMSSGILFAVRSYGFRVESIMFQGDDIANALTLMDFNRDTIDADGNIDANVIDCSFYKSYIGVGGHGRNVNFFNNIFSACRRGIMLFQPTISSIGARGYWVSTNRFHGCTYCLWNDINSAVAVKNVIMENNFCDVGNTFFAGFGDGVYIIGNVIEALSGIGQSQMIGMNAGGVNDTSLMNVIQDNVLVGGPNTTDGIFINNGVKVVISNNVLKHCNRNGIGINADSLAFIKNNIVILGSTLPGAHPIAIAASATGACVDNIIYNTQGITGGAGMTVDRNTVVNP